MNWYFNSKIDNKIICKKDKNLNANKVIEKFCKNDKTLDVVAQLYYNK